MAAWLYQMLYQVSSRMALPGSMRMAQCCGSQRCKMGAMQNPTGSSPLAPPRSRSTVFCRTASTLWLVGKHGNAPVHEEHPFLSIFIHFYTTHVAVHQATIQSQILVILSIGCTFSPSKRPGMHSLSLPICRENS